MSSRAVVEAAWGRGDAHVPSITTRRPRPQAVRARSSPHLPFGFALKRGYPDLPACGPRCGSLDGPVQPSFSKQQHKTLARGQALGGGRHEDLLGGAASPGWLPMRGDIYARCTSRCPHDVSHDDQDQAAPTGAMYQFPLWR